MNYFFYDGSFEGLLTTIAIALAYREDVAGIAAQTPSQSGLFCQEVKVETDAARASRLMTDLSRRFSLEIALDVSYCFLSEVEGFENLIFRYIRLLLAKGGAIAGNAADPVVFQVQRLRSKVAYEAHRFQGFLRFRKMSDGIFYGPINPDHNIVQLLAPHFKARFADQRFLIHDVKRGNGIYYNGSRCLFLSQVMIPEKVVATDVEGYLANDETTYQQLWKTYFQNIAIAERQSKKRQRQCLPARYWRYLVEEMGN